MIPERLEVIDRVQVESKGLPGDPCHGHASSLGLLRVPLKAVETEGKLDGVRGGQEERACAAIVGRSDRDPRAGMSFAGYRFYVFRPQQG